MVRVELLSQPSVHSASDEYFGKATRGCDSLLTFFSTVWKKPNIFLPPPPWKMKVHPVYIKPYLLIKTILNSRAASIIEVELLRMETLFKKP